MIYLVKRLRRSFALNVCGGLCGDLLMATLRDVAVKAEVSIATVSRVLNKKAGKIGITEETQRRVLEAARQLNYQPDKSARNLRLGRSLKAILFMYSLLTVQEAGLEEGQFFPHPFFSHMLHGIQLGATRRGYYLSYLTPSAQIMGFLGKLLDGEVSGVIGWGRFREDVGKLILDKRTPFVAIEPYDSLDSDTRPSIYVDNDMAIHQALEHLVQLGHRRIGLISIAKEGAGEPPQFEDRRQAFRRWVARYGLESFPEQEVLGVPSPGLADEDYSADYSAGGQAATRWLDMSPEQRPSAAIAANDLLALGAMRVLRSRGYKIPRDFSIVGIDDIDWAQYSEPPLTTVRIPKEQMGELAVSLLDKILRGKKLNKSRHLVKTELVVRASTCPLHYMRST